MGQVNLNNSKLRGNSWGELIDINDNSVSSGKYHVYFRDLEARICEHIRECELVLGCVAWLTNDKVLSALEKVRCQIVVQKEDFLRPDIFSDSHSWRNVLRERYSKITFGVDRFECGEIAGSLSVCSDPTVEAIRCVGNYNRDKKPAHPRMHNKFLVFCNYSWNKIKPLAVWTGSFNLTLNATRSFENALFIKNQRIAKAYFMEWQTIFALSEPLDWDTEWSFPEWRIGS